MRSRSECEAFEFCVDGGAIYEIVLKLMCNLQSKYLRIYGVLEGIYEGL